MSFEEWYRNNEMAGWTEAEYRIAEMAWKAAVGDSINHPITNHPIKQSTRNLPLDKSILQMCRDCGKPQHYEGKWCYSDYNTADRFEAKGPRVLNEFLL
jgi:hypothetical protein